MTKPLKTIGTIALIMLFMIGAYFYGQYKLRSKVNQSETATVLLEKIKKVSKLVTTEAYLSEIYNYKEYYYYDISPLRKKVLLRVNAKVSAGYDFEKLQYSVNELEKTITLDSIPDPSILSIDHDLDYYDLQEGTFNAFSEEELTEIQRRAKEFVKDKAIESKLFDEAEIHKQEYLEMLRLVIETMGWSLKLNQDPYLG